MTSRVISPEDSRAVSSAAAKAAARAADREHSRDGWQQVARRINRNRSVRIAARAGLGVNGVVHILIGAIAVGISIGFGGNADQSGALSAIAATPGGLLILWISGVALWGLALWQFTAAAWITAPVRRTRVARRIRDCGKAVGFAALGTGTLVFAAGGRADSEEATHLISKELLGTSGGALVLIAVGITVASIGGTSIFRGISRNFREENTGLHGAVSVIVNILGVLGYVAKGFALMVVGGLAIYAAVFTDPDQAGGLDGALKYLASLPSGGALLIGVATGFVAYGLYLLARSIYLRKEL